MKLFLSADVNFISVYRVVDCFNTVVMLDAHSIDAWPVIGIALPALAAADTW